VKSRNNQIWIFLFEGFNLAHNSSPFIFEVLGLETWPPNARKVPILANFEADLKKYTCFFGPGPARDVNLDFRLPWSAKITAEMLTPGKWRPFKLYLTTTWTAPYFDHTYLGFSSIKMNDFFTKQKKQALFIVIKTLSTFGGHETLVSDRFLASGRKLIPRHFFCFFPNFQSSVP
jgi:hypothetical protein